MGGGIVTTLQRSPHGALVRSRHGFFGRTTIAAGDFLIVVYPGVAPSYARLIEVRVGDVNPESSHPEVLFDLFADEEYAEGIGLNNAKEDVAALGSALDAFRNKHPNSTVALVMIVRGVSVVVARIGTGSGLGFVYSTISGTFAVGVALLQGNINVAVIPNDILSSSDLVEEGDSPPDTGGREYYRVNIGDSRFGFEGVSIAYSTNTGTQWTGAFSHAASAQEMGEDFLATSPNGLLSVTGGVGDRWVNSFVDGIKQVEAWLN